RNPGRTDKMNVTSLSSEHWKRPRTARVGQTCRSALISTMASVAMPSSQCHPPHERRTGILPVSIFFRPVHGFNARTVSEKSLPGGLEPLGMRRKVCQSRQRLYFCGKPFARLGNPSGRRRRPARAERAGASESLGWGEGEGDVTNPQTTNAAPPFSLSSPNEERAEVRSLRVQGKFIRCSALDVGCSMLDVGCWMLDVL